MADKDRDKKLIRMPPEVVAALEADAERCRRSVTKQLEAILVTYYQLDNVELADLSNTRERVSPSLSDKNRWKVPIVEANQNDKTTERKKAKDDRPRKVK